MPVLSGIDPVSAADPDWPEFRGPRGDGHVTAQRLPMHWSEASQVRWKTRIHDRGWSSPVIHGDQIWITTATTDGHRMFAVCIDRNTGEIQHDFLVFEVDVPQKIAAENSYATPTPVIDEQHVYLHYGTYGTACVETASGRIKWVRRDLTCDHETGAGPASSPMLAGNMVIVHVDGRDVQYIIALDRETGRTKWKTNRSVDFNSVPVNKRKAYSMPLLIPDGKGQQLVSNGAQGIYGYNPDTGQELWRVRHHGFSNAPRPVFGQGFIFTTVDRDNPELWAIRAGGQGDVTESHVVWKERKSMPPRCSPLLYDNMLLLINREGIATCLEAGSGKQVWKHRLDGRFSASPLFWNGLIYLFNEDAVCTILRAGPEFESIAESRLDKDLLVATPAVAENALFVRTEKYLYRIDAPKD